MESSQLKRISIVIISILSLSPLDFFSNKLSNENTKKIISYNDIKLEKNYILDNYEIFNPNIKTTNEDIQKLAEKNKEKKSDTKSNPKSEEIENIINIDKTEESSNTIIVEQAPTEKIETAPIPAKPNTNIATNLVEFAKQFVGYSYKPNGTDLYNGVDCSGFTMKIYEQYGYNLTHSASIQATMGSYVPLDNLEPGDLIFYGYNGAISHVAIYIGNSQIVHAATTEDGIKIANYQIMPIITARRILN